MRSGGQSPQQAPAVGEAVVRFQVMDWMLEDGQVVCVTGSIPQLGMWQQDQMLLLTGERHGCWRCGSGQAHCNSAAVSGAAKLDRTCCSSAPGYIAGWQDGAAKHASRITCCCPNKDEAEIEVVSAQSREHLALKGQTVAASHIPPQWCAAPEGASGNRSGNQA